MTDLSGPLFQQGPSTAPVATQPEAKPKAEKRTTRKDVEALLAQFQPATSPEKTKAEKERERLTNQVEANVRGLKDSLVKLRVLEGDLVKAEATFKSLLVVGKNAAAAIAGISDAKLDPPQEKSAKAKPTVVQESAKAAPTAPAEVHQEPAEALPGEEESDLQRNARAILEAAAKAAVDDETGF